MKLQLLLFFLAICRVIAQIPQIPTVRNRDGLISTVPGYAMTYYSARWEPLCGTITTMPDGLDWGVDCVNAIDQFTNSTGTKLAFYDAAGVKLVNTGVGLGRAMCMCFTMSANDNTSYSLCWSFDPIGRYIADGRGRPYGSYRPGASSSLPQCGNVDVGALQAGWTATAIMPSATGPVETVNMGPTTVEHTVTQVLTSILTPTLVNLTITSASIHTDSNGVQYTEDRSYTTTAAVINFEPSPQNELKPGDKIALGIGLGLGLPTLICSIIACKRASRNAEQQRAARAGKAYGA